MISKLDCECGFCGRQHEYFTEYKSLNKVILPQMLFILLKDCDNGGKPFEVVSETEHLKLIMVQI